MKPKTAPITRSKAPIALRFLLDSNDIFHPFTESISGDLNKSFCMHHKISLFQHFFQ
jgi:hypothetical protein